MAEKELYLAALRGDADEVERLLEAGAEIDAPNAQGNTPLHAATLRGQHRVTRLLLARGAKVNAVNKSGNTPLTRAIADHFRTRGNIPDWEALEGHSLRLLLAAGADPRVGMIPTVCYGFSSDGVNREYSLLTVLRELLDAGLDPNRQDATGATLMHAVCGNLTEDLEEGVELLLSYGADIGIRDAHGHTPLHRHLCGNNKMTLDSLQYLVDKGARVDDRDYQGRNALHMVVKGQGLWLGYAGDAETVPETVQRVIEHLIRQGVDPSETDHTGCNALSYFEEHLKEDGVLSKKSVKNISSRMAPVIARLAGIGGLDVSPPGNSKASKLRHNSAVFEANKALLAQTTETVWARAKRLLDNGDTDGLTKLYEQHGRTLIGVDTTRGAESLIHQAARTGRADHISTLLAAGTEFNVADMDGLTPLHMAAEGAHDACVDLLLRAGAAPDVVSDYGVTPLFCINVHPGRNTLADCARTTRTLLAAGADPNVSNSNDISPVHATDSDDALGQLLAHGADPDCIDSSGRSRLHRLMVSESWRSSVGNIDEENTRMVGTLVRHGADKHMMDVRGNLPLHHAVRKLDKVSPGALDAYLNEGGDVNLISAEGVTALMMAVISGGRPEKAIALMERLMGCGADPNAGRNTLSLLYRDEDGGIGRQVKARWFKPEEKREKLQCLLAGGLDVNLKDPQTDNTLLHTLCEVGARVEDISLVLPFCTDFEARNHAGETPVITLLRGPGPSAGALQVLLDRGSRADACDHKGKSVMQYAREIPDQGLAERIAQILLTYGVEDPMAAQTGCDGNGQNTRRDQLGARAGR